MEISGDKRFQEAKHITRKDSKPRDKSLEGLFKDDDRVELSGNSSMVVSFPPGRDEEISGGEGNKSRAGSDPCSTGIKSVNDPCSLGIKSLSDPCSVSIKGMSEPCSVTIKSLHH